MRHYSGRKPGASVTNSALAKSLKFVNVLWLMVYREWVAVNSIKIPGAIIS